MKDGLKGLLDNVVKPKGDSKDGGAGRAPIQPAKTNAPANPSRAGDAPKPGQPRPAQSGGNFRPPVSAPAAPQKLEAGMKGVLIKDANLKYDSYGSGRPDGKPTQTLKTGTPVEINNVVASPKPGQTHTVHVNGVGWIQADAVKV